MINLKEKLVATPEEISLLNKRKRNVGLELTSKAG